MSSTVPRRTSHPESLFRLMMQGTWIYMLAKKMFRDFVKDVIFSLDVRHNLFVKTRQGFQKITETLVVAMTNLLIFDPDETLLIALHFNSSRVSSQRQGGKNNLMHRLSAGYKVRPGSIVQIKLGMVSSTYPRSYPTVRLLLELLRKDDALIEILQVAITYCIILHAFFTAKNSAAHTFKLFLYISVIYVFCNRITSTMHTTPRPTD